SRLGAGKYPLGRLAAEGCEALEVDAGPVVGLDEDHEDAFAGAAADDRARGLQVHRELGDHAAVPAGSADAGGGGHLGPEDLLQQAADGVPVEGFHQVPPVAPNRSVFTRCGGYPDCTSACDTASTKLVGPQAYASGIRLAGHCTSPSRA